MEEAPIGEEVDASGDGEIWFESIGALWSPSNLHEEDLLKALVVETQNLSESTVSSTEARCVMTLATRQRATSLRESVRIALTTYFTLPNVDDEKIETTVTSLKSSIDDLEQ